MKHPSYKKNSLGGYFLPLPPQRGGHVNCLTDMCPPLEGDKAGGIKDVYKR